MNVEDQLDIVRTGDGGRGHGWNTDPRTRVPHETDADSGLLAVGSWAAPWLRSTAYRPLEP